MQAINTPLDSLAADGDSVEVFRRHSFHENIGSFLMSPCDAILSTGELSLCLSAYDGTFSETSSNFLVVKVKSMDVSLQTVSQKLSLDEDIFKTIYRNIKDKLEPFMKRNHTQEVTLTTFKLSKAVVKEQNYAIIFL